MNHTDKYRPLETLADLHSETAEEAKAKGDTVLALQETQRAKEYLTRAIDIVHTRLTPASEHLKRLTTKLKSIIGNE
jgi:hypothetical protein